MKSVNEKINDLIRHIEHVKDNCLLLGMRLINANQPDTGRLLIANGLIHDNSKFYGVEWDYLNDTSGDPELLKIAIHQHNSTNQHHPEFWGGIEFMPRLYVAEMVCDWKARSTEFGTSLQDWVDGQAAAKYGYSVGCAVHQKIKFFSSLLCDSPFNKI